MCRVDPHPREFHNKLKFLFILEWGIFGVTGQEKLYVPLNVEHYYASSGATLHPSWNCPDRYVHPHPSPNLLQTAVQGMIQIFLMNHLPLEVNNKPMESRLDYAQVNLSLSIKLLNTSL